MMLDNPIPGARPMMRLLIFVVLLLSSTLTCFGQENAYVLALESPEYPVLARQAQIEGAVRVEVVVGEDGHVVSAKAISGHRLLRQEAEENLKTWTFTSGTRREFEINYEFQLQAPKVPYVPVTRVQFKFPTNVTLTTHAPLPIEDGTTIQPKKKK
jgi:TonB family protein